VSDVERGWLEKAKYRASIWNGTEACWSGSSMSKVRLPQPVMPVEIRFELQGDICVMKTL
jgi:hypothetical protein